ncbi:MAG: DUF4145 domain-containing protein [Ruminococcaceae bacterium]|nr:DUF4145 domain-containing protein [Oscillospiraceae bacterium]
MSLWKRLKEVVIGKPVAPAKPAPLPPLPPIPQKKAAQGEQRPKKVPPQPAKKPSPFQPVKAQVLAYNKMHADYKKMKQLLGENNTAEAIKKARQVVSQCLNLEGMRKNLPPDNKRHLQKLQELKKKDVIGESIGRQYEKTIVMLSPEKEAAFDGKKAEELIQSLGRIVNYEKTEIFKKGAAEKSKKQPAKPPKKQSQPKVNLSFKAKETKGKTAPVSFEKENRALLGRMKTAKTYLAQKKLTESLSHLRQALESMARTLCKAYGVRETPNMTLENRIDALRAPVLLSPGQANIFHQVRQIANRGAHFSENPPSVSDAEKAYSLAEEVLYMYRTILQNEKKNDANVPLGGPEYYSPNRKYYGRWYDLNTRQALSMNTEFMQLQEKAEGGDIGAMLDIAVGFLPANIPWTGVSLVRHPENARFCDPYDARYYYWITRACDAAYTDWRLGKPLPLPYLATALLEGLKFYVYHEYHRRHPGNTDAEDQYHKVVNFMFGKFRGKKEDFADMLLAMMEEYGNQKIICPIHAEQTKNHVKFLLYLSGVQYKAERWYGGRDVGFTYSLKNGRSELTPEKYAISPEDKGKTCNSTVEKYHDFVYDMHHAYCKQIGHRYLETYRRSFAK